MTPEDHIDHLQHPTALLLRDLLVREKRAQQALIIIDDEENILQALDAGIKLKQLICTDPKQLPAALEQQLPASVKISTLSKRTGKKIFGGEKISRLFALAERPPAINTNSLSTNKGDIIVLDRLSISGNIGAICRTAVALNAGAIVLIGTDHDGIYDRRVIRASRGLIFALPVISLSEDELINYCQQSQTPLLVMAAQANTDINSACSNPEQLAIVLGSEKHGCSNKLMEAANQRTAIPLNPQVESLNVSVAASIVLYLRLANRQQAVRT